MAFCWFLLSIWVRQAPSPPHRITHGDSVSSTTLDQCPLQTSTLYPLGTPVKNREYVCVGGHICPLNSIYFIILHSRIFMIINHKNQSIQYLEKCSHHTSMHYFMAYVVLQVNCNKQFSLLVKLQQGPLIPAELLCIRLGPKMCRML